MDSKKPSEIDITGPNSTAFVFEEANRRYWHKLLRALAKELRSVDYKFANVAKGYPLDARAKLRLVKAITKAEVVWKFPACTDQWDDFTAERVADGYGIALLDEVLSVLAQENIHLVPSDVETGPVEDFPLAASTCFSSHTKNNTNLLDNKHIVSNFLGSFCGVLLGALMIGTLLSLSEPPEALPPIIKPSPPASTDGYVPPFLHLDDPTAPVQPMEVE
jgi:hypothetical protein